MNTNTIYSLFQKNVELYKNNLAIIENNRTLTFGEFSDMVDTIAATFPENVKCVGIVMPHGAEMIAAIFATLKRGARYVPAEVDCPTGRIDDMFLEAEVDCVLTTHNYAKKVNNFPVKFVDCAICTGNSIEERYTVELTPLLPAYILYTSGTTGHPKGVCVTNGNVCHYVQAFASEFHPTSNDIMLQYSVCSFDIFVEEVFASLLNGTALAIPSDEDKKNINSLMQFVKSKNVTIISGFPYLLAEMNHLPSIPKSLRLLISGGDVLRKIYVGNIMEHVDIYNTYGPSETTVCATYYHCNNGITLNDGTFPIGHPVEGAEIHIVDVDGNDVNKGEVGEICIGGNGVSDGYIGNHNEENKAFELQEDGSVIYRSGDLGYYLSDDNIAFIGRKDSQIMVYGKRVEIEEVESRLYQCKNIHQAAVCSFTDDEGLPYIVAYIVPSDDNLKISDVRKELAENLPNYMIPEYFVKMVSIPLNTNGKVDMTQLPVVMKEGKINEHFN